MQDFSGGAKYYYAFLLHSLLYEVAKDDATPPESQRYQSQGVYQALEMGQFSAHNSDILQLTYDKTSPLFKQGSLINYKLLPIVDLLLQST